MAHIVRKSNMISDIVKYQDEHIANEIPNLFILHNFFSSVNRKRIRNPK